MKQSPADGTVTEELIEVDHVVQDYMDNLLADLFPEADNGPKLKAVQKSSPAIDERAPIDQNPSGFRAEPRTSEYVAPVAKIKAEIDPVISEPLLEESTQVKEKTEPQETVLEQISKTEVSPPKKQIHETSTEPVSHNVEQAPALQDNSTQKPAESFTAPKPKTEGLVSTKVAVSVKTVTTKPVTTKPVTSTALEQPIDVTISEVSEISELTEAKDLPETAVEVEVEKEIEVPKRYPDAPAWAQQAFDVLLFDVCGLKLAVPMESLGQIIKAEHETNLLIGRPDWFMGAYNESKEHLYVVDTAKYIMPEKGFDSEGFDYIIQLQRSKWTLACQNVYSTIRLEPDQVKWRSNNGKRKWLSGTVVEHMCALIHVDNLVELLEAETS